MSAKYASTEHSSKKTGVIDRRFAYVVADVGGQSKPHTHGHLKIAH
jgi:hypothetical protein